MTPIADFYDPVRFLLGDHEEQPMYGDAAVARGVRVLVKGGHLPGYRLTTDNTAITPTVSDPNKYMLLSAKVAKAFISSTPSGASFATRPLRETVGSFAGLGFDLDKMIYDLENGAMFDGWQSLGSWLEGVSGVKNIWQHWTRLNTAFPVEQVTVGADGVTGDGGTSVSAGNQIFSFTYGGPVASDVRLLGEAVWPGKMQIYAIVANANRAPVGGPVTFMMEVGGEDRASITLGDGETRVEEKWDERIEAGQAVRFRCADAPDPVDSASEISIAISVRPFTGA